MPLLYVILQMAREWGVPPWELDPDGNCGHGPTCPRNRRWIHYQLEIKAMEAKFR